MSVSFQPCNVKGRRSLPDSNGNTHIHMCSRDKGHKEKHRCWHCPREW